MNEDLTALKAEWVAKEERMLALIVKKYGKGDGTFGLPDDEQKELDSIFKWRLETVDNLFKEARKEGLI